MRSSSDVPCLILLAAVTGLALGGPVPLQAQSSEIPSPEIPSPDAYGPVPEGSGPPVLIPSGSRIRVEGPWMEPRTGSLERLDAEGVRMVPDAGGSPVFLAARQIDRVAVYRGTRSGAGRGAAIGAGIGGGLAVLLAVAAQSDDWIAPNLADSALLVGLSSASFGGIGALIGSATEHEVWDRVPDERLPWQVGVGRGPAGGLALSATLRF